MNDRGPQPPDLDSLNDQAEPEQVDGRQIIRIVEDDSENSEIAQPVAPPAPLNRNDQRVRLSRSHTDDGDTAMGSQHPQTTAAPQTTQQAGLPPRLNLEDPRVRAELARRLELQRIKREQAQLSRQAAALMASTASDSMAPDRTANPIPNDHGQLPPPSQAPHVVTPQQLPPQAPRRSPPLATEPQARAPSTPSVPRRESGAPAPAPQSGDEQAPAQTQAIASRPSTELEGETESTPKRGIGRFLLRTILLFVIPVVAVLAGLWFYLHGGRYVVTENAYLKTNIIAVSADLPGRVVDVAVSDNQNVAVGDLLFRIDAEKYLLEIDQAEADLAVIARDVESLRGNYREALMENRQANKRIEHLEQEFARQQKMRDKQIGTGRDFDRARNDLEIAQSEGRVYREKLARALADLGGADDSPVEAHPRYGRALATKALAESLLKRTEIRAAAAGVVTNMRLQPGEWVDDGKPVFSIIDSEQLWIEANLKETQLTNISEGQSVSFVVDAYPNHDFTAEVDRIAPATGSEFALLPPQNATGNWVKVVQRVPLTLKIIPNDTAPVLRAGMTAKVKIDSEKERDLPQWLIDFDKRQTLPDIVRSFLGLTRYDAVGNQ